MMLLWGRAIVIRVFFMLNVYDIINNNASSFSAYIVDSCDI